LNCFQRSTRLNPNAAEAWAGQGIANLALKRPRQALKNFERALELESTLAAAWVGQGDAWLQLKEFEKALPGFIQALQLQTNLLVALIGQGEAQLGLNRPGMALRSFNEAIGRDPNSVEAWSGRSRVQQSLGLEKEARESLRRATQLRRAEGNQVPRRLVLLLPVLGSGVALQWLLRTSLTSASDNPSVPVASPLEEQVEPIPAEDLDLPKLSPSPSAQPRLKEASESQSPDAQSQQGLTASGKKNAADAQSEPTFTIGGQEEDIAAAIPDSVPVKQTAQASPDGEQDLQIDSVLPQKAVPDPELPSPESIRQAPVERQAKQKSRKQSRRQLQEQSPYYPNPQPPVETDGLQTESEMSTKVEVDSVEVDSILPQKAVLDPKLPSTEDIRQIPNGRQANQSLPQRPSKEWDQSYYPQSSRPNPKGMQDPLPPPAATKQVEPDQLGQSDASKANPAANPDASVIQPAQSKPTVAPDGKRSPNIAPVQPSIPKRQEQNQSGKSKNTTVSSKKRKERIAAQRSSPVEPAPPGQVKSFLPQKAGPEPAAPSAESIRKALTQDPAQNLPQESSRLYYPDPNSRQRVNPKEGSSAASPNSPINSVLPQKAVPNPPLPGNDRIQKALAEKNSEQSPGRSSQDFSRTDYSGSDAKGRERRRGSTSEVLQDNQANSLLPQKAVPNPAATSVEQIRQSLSKLSGASTGRKTNIIWPGWFLLTGLLAALILWRTGRLDAKTSSQDTGIKPPEADAPSSATEEGNAQREEGERRIGIAEAPQIAAKSISPASTLVVPTKAASTETAAEAEAETKTASTETEAETETETETETEIRVDVADPENQDGLAKTTEIPETAETPPQEPEAIPSPESSTEPAIKIVPDDVVSQIGHQRLIIDSQASAYVLERSPIQALQSQDNFTTLEPGRYVIRINRGAFSYWKDAPQFTEEPWVLLWIHGGQFINKQTQTTVDSTWVTLNGYNDALALQVIETTTLCGMFMDTHKESNGGQVKLSVLAMG